MGTGMHFSSARMSKAAVSLGSGTEEAQPIAELGFLGDVPLEIEIVLDRPVIMVSEVAAWEPGSILILNKPAGEQLEIFVSGELIGHGEIDVSHDNVGIRITGLAS